MTATLSATLAATAFLMPGYGEWILILVVALLIFGRRLPEVGRTVGKTVTEFRRGLQNLKEDMHKDEDLREVRSVVHDFKRAVDVPRTYADPRRLLENLTDESLATPGPDATVATAPPERSLLEMQAEASAPESGLHAGLAEPQPPVNEPPATKAYAAEPSAPLAPEPYAAQTPPTDPLPEQQHRA